MEVINEEPDTLGQTSGGSAGPLETILQSPPPRARHSYSLHSSNPRPEDGGEAPPDYHNNAAEPSINSYHGEESPSNLQGPSDSLPAHNQSPLHTENNEETADSLINQSSEPSTGGHVVVDSIFARLPPTTAGALKLRSLIRDLINEAGDLLTHTQAKALISITRGRTDVGAQEARYQWLGGWLERQAAAPVQAQTTDQATLQSFSPAPILDDDERTYYEVRQEGRKVHALEQRQGLGAYLAENEQQERLQARTIESAASILERVMQTEDDRREAAEEHRAYHAMNKKADQAYEAKRALNEEMKRKAEKEYGELLKEEQRARLAEQVQAQMEAEAEFNEWLDICVHLFEHHGRHALERLPFPDLEGCTLEHCPNFGDNESLPCFHTIEIFVRSSGRMTLSLLDELADLWYPGKFRDCHEDVRDRFQKAAWVLYASFMRIYEAEERSLGVMDENTAAVDGRSHVSEEVWATIAQDLAL